MEERSVDKREPPTYLPKPINQELSHGKHELRRESMIKSPKYDNAEVIGNKSELRIATPPNETTRHMGGNLNIKIREIQELKRGKKYSEALSLALELVTSYPSEPLAYKSLAKVQALTGEVGAAKDSMAMVLNLFQTDLTTAFVDTQYNQRITPLFQHLFLEYVNAAYYVDNFHKHINRSLPESIKSALLGESIPKAMNSAVMKNQIKNGIRLCNPFWDRNPNDFKRTVESLIDSISLK